LAPIIAALGAERNRAQPIYSSAKLRRGLLRPRGFPRLLERSFATGDGRRISVQNPKRIANILRALDDGKLPKRGLPPMHPGELLREEILPALDRPKTEIAKLLGVSRQTLYDVLKERQQA
jgi:hypothetical protein